MAEEENQQQGAVVTINGTDYPVSSLSDEAKAQLQSFRFAEREVERLKAQLALAQTALNAYRRGVIANLPEKQ